MKNCVKCSKIGRFYLRGKGALFLKFIITTLLIFLLKFCAPKNFGPVATTAVAHAVPNSANRCSFIKYSNVSKVTTRFYFYNLKRLEPIFVFFDADHPDKSSF